ncbi:N-Acetyl-D-glucosamine ABC transport system, sugar-binding protein [Alloactinosynnema sp. L-07]|uniref:ABC transporter substrate-binding protein n=1 Tax=Alloactinosynnema sp. L-07 TaxID=1653480 RepID=UPI00065EF2BE|nr:sugar ABC transporter substrate-binding protein [Alloactinosynnema sp. L-07]CRK56080.1 N-Acetyl-D-glucosamine ABC transport system, sugar-binding protein [Alloactinosynnema sp. L-07]
MRFARSLALLMATATVASACSAEVAAGPAGSVSLLVFGDPNELAAYRELEAAYELAVPGADLRLIEASDRKDLITKLSTSISGGNPPDLFLMNYRFYGQFAKRDAIEPVQERLDQSKAIRAADFYPQALSAFQIDGKQLCMPQNVSSLVVYYNRTLFAKYGIAEPKPGWGWPDMVATAAGLTRDANGDVAKGADPDAAPGTPAPTGPPPATYGLGVSPEVIRLAPFVWSNGGTLFDDERRPTRFALDGPAIEALSEFIDLRGRHGVVPTDQEVESEDDEARFAAGKLGMLMSSRRSTTTFRKITGFEWDVAPLPVHKSPATVLHSDAYCVTKGSKNKSGAWRFVEYALGKEGAAIMARTGRTVPSTVEVSRSPAFLDATKPPRSAAVFLDSIATIRATPTISTWPEIEDVANGILENALYYGHQPQEVARQLDEQTRSLFERGR